MDLISVISVVGLFVLIVVVHELFHLGAAKLCGIRVLQFGIGFIPIYRFKSSSGMEWAIGGLPLGGYVKMAEPPENCDERDQIHYMSTTSPVKQFTIAAAGPLGSWFLAFLLLIVTLSVNGLPVATMSIGNFSPDSAAQASGIQIGDKIVSLDGQAVTDWDGFAKRIGESGERPLKIGVTRSGEELVFSVTPRSGRIGVASATEIVAATASRVVILSFQRSVGIVFEQFAGLSQLFTGRAPLSGLSGPVGLFNVASDQAKSGVWNLLVFGAFLSSALAAFNLIPLGGLDGGHMLKAVVHLALRRRLDSFWSFYEFASVGLLLVLILFATKQDIVRALAS